MYSQDELRSLHGFLRSTAEGNLKKMLIGGQMSEIHLRLLLKVVREGEDQFVTHWEAGTFPKVKLNAGEIAIKEHCYEVCGQACAKVGLLSAAKKAA